MAEQTTTTETNPATAALSNGADSGAPWYGANLDDDTREYVEKRGWKEPAEVFKSFRSLERLVGAADRIAIPEKDADPLTWDGFDKLGALKDAAAYKEAVKLGDDKAGLVHQEAVDSLFEVAPKARLLPAQTKAILDHFADIAKQQADEKTAAAAEEQRKLDIEIANKWGSQKDANLDLGRRAAKEFFGADEAALNKLAETFGSFAMLDGFARMGKAMAEGNLLGKGESGMGLSRDQALGEIQKMKADEQVVAIRMNAQHPRYKEVEGRWQELHKIAYPQEAA